MKLALGPETRQSTIAGFGPYARRCDAFPYEATFSLSFDPEQYTAYRDLGYCTALKFGLGEFPPGQPREAMQPAECRQG